MGPSPARRERITGSREDRKGNRFVSTNASKYQHVGTLAYASILSFMLSCHSSRREMAINSTRVMRSACICAWVMHVSHMKLCRHMWNMA